MRFVKILLLGLILVVVISPTAMSQIGCEDLVKSSFDTLRVLFSEAPPGDTALIPVMLSHDSIVTAFQFLIEYDSTYLRPVFIRDSTCAAVDSVGNCIEWNIDSTFIEAVVANRFVKTQTINTDTGIVLDTITKFSANLFQGRRNIMAFNFLPQLDDIDSLPPPVDSADAFSPIFYVKMAVDPAMPELQTSEFIFHESNIFIVDTVGGLPDSTQVNGCNQSQMTTIWSVGPDSNETYQIYPTTDIGIRYLFRANSNVTPTPTVNLSVSPSTIDINGSATLSWTSTNADSVVVREGSVRLTDAANGQTAGNIVVTKSLIGTYTYQAVAYASQGAVTATSSAVLTVQEGGGGTGPTITTSTIANSYNQGELITFTVTATNTNGSQITLSASSLPANASFGVGGQVTGNTPLTGDFSWTPDFNQEGLFTIRFSASDDDGTSTRDVTVQVNELQFDRLFSTSAPGNNPVGGLPGKSEVAFPIDLVTAQTVYGVQFDMLYPTAIVRVDSFVTTARIPDYVVYDNIGSTPGEIRVVTFGLDNEPVADTNTTAILQALLTIDSTAAPWGDYWIHLVNGRESVNPDPDVGSLPLVSDSGIVEVDRFGDVNLDRYIDVADVVNIVAYIIGNFGLTERQFDVADIIGNDSVNVFDLVADINLIYGIEPETTPAPPVQGEAVMELAYNNVSQGASDVLTVASELPTAVAGVQLEINYDANAVELGTPRLTSYNTNFALRSNNNGAGKMKILLYHLSPFKTDELIQPGVADLVEIPITARRNLEAGDKSVLRLSEALLSTSDAASVSVSGVEPPLPDGFELSQNYPNPFNPTTTIDFALSTSARVKLDIFNILGRHVKTLVDGHESAGEHRIEWDATDDRGRRVATGIYLYRLQVDDAAKTRKMLFLK
ncbi:T9SS type A sorting domain-containing protein [candidate division GN15 bacterium]|nr:T9SS type A sorting domain-containing protein [candidate division GN15 bacterium]